MADKLTPLDQLLQQTQGMEGDDLANQYQELIQTAPPEVIQQAHADALAQFSGEERQQIAETLRAANNDPNQAFQFSGMSGGSQDTDPQQLAAMFGQAQRQQPGLLNHALGLSGGGGNNPLMQMVISAVIQMVMTRMMGGGAQAGGVQSGGLDLGSILGQVLAGRAGGAGGLGSSAGQSRQGGGMSSLDDLLGRAGGQVSGRNEAEDDNRSGTASTGGGGLADILGQLASGGGAGGGLGSILGQLAGGLSADQGGTDRDQPGTRNTRNQ